MSNWNLHTRKKKCSRIRRKGLPGRPLFGILKGKCFSWREFHIDFPGRTCAFTLLLGGGYFGLFRLHFEFLRKRGKVLAGVWKPGIQIFSGNFSMPATLRFQVVPKPKEYLDFLWIWACLLLIIVIMIYRVGFSHCELFHSTKEWPAWAYCLDYLQVSIPREDQNYELLGIAYREVPTNLL
jgi:hypothetical protein